MPRNSNSQLVLLSDSNLSWENLVELILILIQVGKAETFLVVQEACSMLHALWTLDSPAIVTYLQYETDVRKFVIFLAWKHCDVSVSHVKQNDTQALIAQELHLETSLRFVTT